MKNRKTLFRSLSILLAFTLLAASGGGRASAFSDGDMSVTVGSGRAESGEVLITLSDSGCSCDSAAVSISGGSVTIGAAGTYRVTGSLSDGQIVIDAGKSDKVRLILDGAGITKAGSAAVLALRADKLILSAAADSVNVLASAGRFTGSDNVDAAVFAKCDLTINGEGAILVNCEKGHGIVCKDDLLIKGAALAVRAAKKGAVGKDSVRVEGGSLDIEAGTKGLVSSDEENEEHGRIVISGGSLTVKAGDDGLHAVRDLTVSGGTLCLTSGDDAIHAGAALLISGGSIAVLESYEGLEAQTIEIRGGTLDVRAKDDGFNAAGGNDGSNARGKFGGDPFAGDSSASVTISGGEVSINADGDGIDSNGGLYVSGGVLTVSGPTNSANGALDFGTDSAITGGTVIAAGASGMAVNFGSASTQGSILLSFPTQAAGSTVSVSDGSGAVLVSFSPAKSYNSVVVSTEGMALGGSYTVTAGDYSETVTLDSLIYGGKGGFGGGPGGPGGGGFWGFGGGPGGPGGERPGRP